MLEVGGSIPSPPTTPELQLNNGAWTLPPVPTTGSGYLTGATISSNSITACPPSGISIGFSTPFSRLLKRAT